MSSENTSNLSLNITAHLVCYTTAKAKAGSKAKPKETKVPKIKEMKYTLLPTSTNYFDLLNSALVKHGEEKYKAKDGHLCGIKVLAPPNTRKSDAINIDTTAEYIDFVKELQDRERPPLKISIFIDMKNVHQGLLKIKRGGQATVGEANGPGSTLGPDDDSEDEDDEPDDEIDGLSKNEASLARFRIMLEKAHANDHDSGYTYVYPDGTDLPLTPFLMNIWARAMHDGQATVQNPPNCEAFDPASHRSRLFRSASSKPPSSASLAGTPATGASELSHLATIVSALFPAARGRPDATQTPGTPTRPSRTLSDHNTLPAIPFELNSSPDNTPTKLPRFLDHAESKLGIMGARNLEFSMQLDGIGPDILPEISDENLAAMLSLPRGDIIRMKKGAQKWWHSSDAKRKRTDSLDIGTSGGIASGSEPPPNKKVSFEWRGADGGRKRYYGPRMDAVEEQSDEDRETWYFCEARAAWFPLPQGFTPVMDPELQY